ncbi:hypothetical protein AOL_s00091g10 [Orbilia oligospora ATCC 24927]|uniref:Uncharacterized protein n=1 Tax=Arthrobotrys oligospora (strain ATCC 24927 / CBS 115.81 / DSM 1491) TaxID=756982 RepID=G1XHV8_ARTOA|nr:hypothetical protein AOL_s00091g10 [Orbilia oligospora ATCC 24927]EGX47266.1 hypothetical protein AOL_s00091g10 [Orbilia oligospora ATCC 24927]
MHGYGFIYTAIFDSDSQRRLWLNLYHPYTTWYQSIRPYLCKETFLSYDDGEDSKNVNTIVASIKYNGETVGDPFNIVDDSSYLQFTAKLKMEVQKEEERETERNTGREGEEWGEFVGDGVPKLIVDIHETK